MAGESQRRCPVTQIAGLRPPIGRALLGKQEGDEVTVPTPNGQRVFELVKLATIHD